MFGLLSGGIGLLISFVVGVALLGTLGVVLWALTLPFRLLGLVFKGLGLLLLLPVLLPLGIFGILVFGIGFALALAPAIPIVLVALGVWWLVRRRGPSPA